MSAFQNKADDQKMGPCAWNLFFYIDYFSVFCFYRWFFVPYLNNQSQRFLNVYWEKNLSGKSYLQALL